jgi:hypothetical protein
LPHRSIGTHGSHFVGGSIGVGGVGGVGGGTGGNRVGEETGNLILGKFGISGLFCFNFYPSLIIVNILCI